MDIDQTTQCVESLMKMPVQLVAYSVYRAQNVVNP